MKALPEEGDTATLRTLRQRKRLGHVLVLLGHHADATSVLEEALAQAQQSAKGSHFALAITRILIN